MVYNKESLSKPLAITGICLITLLTAMQCVRVVSGDYTVPQGEYAAPTLVKPVIKHDSLFGAYEGKDKPLQESALNLQISAVFAMQDPLKGSAVISASGRKPLLLIVGDALPGGATLKEVHEDYVVLEQAGQQSVLRLPKKSL